MATSYDLFIRAERIEAVSAAIYRNLAELFRGDPEARALFARLEAEELQHAIRVRLLAATYRNDPRLVERVDADTPTLDACLAEGERALADLKCGAWGADLAEVKRRVATLEERLSRAHAEILARAAHPAVREFFARLARQDEAHERLLR